MDTPSEVKALVKAGALFVLNDSAGKDSQIMKIKLLSLVPKEQLVIVHADLGEVEWPGNEDHIKEYSFGVDTHVVRAGKTFFDLVDKRQKFPSPSIRQCTSDLKRAPIQKFINNYAKDNKFDKVVNCMGLRAQESSGRAKKVPFSFKEKLSARHRQQFEWLPVHDMQLDDVFEGIDKANQQPHYAYGLGMKRLSCSFCIMGCDSDLKIAGKHRPELADKYIVREEQYEFTMSMSRRYLKDIIKE